MRTITAIMFGAALLSTPAMAASDHCEADIAAINTALSKAKLSAADTKVVNDALAKGAELRKAGKDEGCEKVLASAQKLLGIKDKHSH
jgi:hypothetical protein